MIEALQNFDDEAAYISENFGIPYTTALEITLDAAKKKSKKKNK